MLVEYIAFIDTQAVQFHRHFLICRSSLIYILITTSLVLYYCDFQFKLQILGMGRGGRLGKVCFIHIDTQTL